MDAQLESNPDTRSMRMKAPERRSVLLLHEFIPTVPRWSYFRKTANDQYFQRCIVSQFNTSACIHQHFLPCIEQQWAIRPKLPQQKKMIEECRAPPQAPAAIREQSNLHRYTVINLGAYERGITSPVTVSGKYLTVRRQSAPLSSPCYLVRLSSTAADICHRMRETKGVLLYGCSKVVASKARSPVLLRHLNSTLMPTRAISPEM